MIGPKNIPHSKGLSAMAPFLHIASVRRLVINNVTPRESVCVVSHNIIPPLSYYSKVLAWVSLVFAIFGGRAL